MQARALAVSLLEQARNQARHIESRAQARAAGIQRGIDTQLETYRKSCEARGADALRKLRLEAIDRAVMDDSIASLVRFILLEDEIGERGKGA